MGELREETDLLKKNLEAQLVQVEQLQNLLSIERKKEFVTYVTGKERDKEILHLKQAIVTLETDR